MKEKTCCVTGHRFIPIAQTDWVRERLQQEVARAVAEGYTRFLSGFARGVDQWFVQAVMAQKAEHPNLHLVAVLPYAQRYHNLLKDEDTKAMLAACSQVAIVAQEYNKGVYNQRNKYMAEQSSLLIAVFDGRNKNGAVSTFSKAKRMGGGIEIRVIPVKPYLNKS